MKVVVVGGGHNGLVAGVVLARAGLDVTVVEGGAEAGGCIWTSDRPSGHRLELGAVDHGGMVEVADELDLTAHGLRYVERDTVSGAAFGDGTVLTFPVSSSATADLLGADGPAYRGLVATARQLFGMLDQFPDPPTPTALGAALGALRGGDELYRTVLSSSDVVLERTLADAHLRSAVAMYGSHAQLPPWLPGTGMFSMLLPAAHDAPVVRPVGGSRALIAALTAALDAAGGALMTGDPVAAIVEHSGRPQVHLASGAQLRADRVVSSLDVVRTTGLLDDPPAVLTAASGRVGSGRLNVAELKIDLAFDGPIGSDVLGGAAADSLWLLQPRPDSLRRTFGNVVAGRLPPDPAAMWAVPSAHDSSAAPPGGAVLWLSSFVPRHLHGAEWDDASEQEAADRVLGAVGEIAGVDLRARASEVVVTGPAAWPSRLGSADGNPNHIDATLDQLLGWRPPGMAGHRSPVPWLYLAGAGTHPGGGLTGVPGRDAAKAVLADLGGGRSMRGLPARVAAEVSSLWSALRLYRSMRRGGST